MVGLYDARFLVGLMYILSKVSLQNYLVLLEVGHRDRIRLST